MADNGIIVTDNDIKRDKMAISIIPRKKIDIPLVDVFIALLFEGRRKLQSKKFLVFT